MFKISAEAGVYTYQVKNQGKTKIKNRSLVNYDYLYRQLPGKHGVYQRQFANARRVERHGGSGSGELLIGTCIGKSLCYYLRGEEFRGANTRRVVHFIEVFIRKYHSYLVSYA